MMTLKPIVPHMQAMHEIAVMRWDAGEYESALRLWRQGCAAAAWLEKSFKNNFQFPHAEALMMLGREAEAQAVAKPYYEYQITQALQRLGRIPVSVSAKPSKGKIEEALMQARWEEALSLVEAISPHALYEKHRAALRAKIAVALWQAGQTERAVGLLEQAEAEAQTIMPSQRNETLHCIAEAWAVYDREQALRVYREAVETLQTIPEGYRAASLDRLIASLETSGFYNEIPDLLDEIPDWNERPAAHLASLRYGINCVQQEPTTEALENLTDATRRAISTPNRHDREWQVVHDAVKALLDANYLPFSFQDMQLLRTHQWPGLFAKYFCHLYEHDQLTQEFRAFWPLQRAEEKVIWWDLPRTSTNPERAAKLLRMLMPCLEVAYSLARLERFDDALAVLDQVTSDEYQGVAEDIAVARGVIRAQASVGATRL